MVTKEPVLMTILIDTNRMRWLVGSIDLQNNVIPLIASTDGDLSYYRSLTFDEQASFLRHRFCGVMQRGCDRLWGIQKKACHFVFVTDAAFPEASKELTERVAEHLADWMTNPPVTFFLAPSWTLSSEVEDGNLLAGRLPAEYFSPLTTGLVELKNAADDDSLWESVPPAKPRV